jgi:hypothetical protein
MGKLDGRCLCGKVTYTCEGEPLATAACHCTECQRQTGTSFSAIVAVPRDALRFEGSTRSFTTVGTDSGKEVDRHFCPECGSPLFSYAAGMPQMAFIKAGTLDDSTWFEPQMHVWTESAQDWVALESHGGTKLPRGPG